MVKHFTLHCNSAPRFKEFLKKSPGTRPPSARPAPLHLLPTEDPEYYNDLPGKAPPPLSSNLIDLSTELPHNTHYINSDVQVTIRLPPLLQPYTIDLSTELPRNTHINSDVQVTSSTVYQTSLGSRHPLSKCHSQIRYIPLLVLLHFVAVPVPVICFAPLKFDIESHECSHQLQNTVI